MNNISIMGRMTADPELRYTANGHAVLSFTVAVQRPRSKDVTDFIRCVAWRNAAIFISKYFTKGKMIAVSGIETSRSWKDDNGNTHSVNELLVDVVEFCGDKAAKHEPAAMNELAAETPTAPPDIPDSFAAADDVIPF